MIDSLPHNNIITLVLKGPKIEMALKPDPEQPEIESLTINHQIGSDSHRDTQQISILELGAEDEEDIKEWFVISSKITIMVTGETGVGKSTLLNALVGYPVFETGRSKKQAVTKHVTERKCTKDGIEIASGDRLSGFTRWNG